MLSQMTEEETQGVSSLSQPVGPLPDSQFIASNQLTQRPVELTITSKAGKARLAKKRKVNSKSAAAKKRKN
uniref:Uncharacterized protein n=1 Tax=Setaria italica TaxID=4555 RepID=K3YKM5_SETIT